LTHISDLLKRARELEINRSALEENREAIAKYNELVDANGVFSDGVRRF